MADKLYQRQDLIVVAVDLFVVQDGTSTEEPDNVPSQLAVTHVDSVFAEALTCVSVCLVDLVCIVPLQVVVVLAVSQVVAVNEAAWMVEYAKVNNVYVVKDTLDQIAKNQSVKNVAWTMDDVLAQTGVHVPMVTLGSVVN